MLQLLVTLQSFVAGRIERDEKGATAVEYGLMVGLIAAVIVITVGLLGVKLDGLFSFVNDSIPAAPTAP